MKKTIVLFGIISLLAAANEKAIVLEESVISTTGFVESLLKENKNVTIVSREDLNRKDYRNLEEVLRDTPNVMVQQTYFGPVVDLRGNGERALSRVKVLVDGIAINPIDESMGSSPINTIPISSVDRIEIIPGGGAVLNGSGTAGGVVNIITKSTERKNYFAVDYGNFSYATNKTSISAGYNVNKDLYVHGGYSYLKGNGYRDGDDKEHGTANAGFEYQITSNQKVRFNASKFRGNEDNSTPILKSELAKNRRKSGYPVEGRMTRDSYSLDYEVKPSEDLTLLTTLYSQHLNRKFTENSILDEYVLSFPSRGGASGPPPGVSPGAGMPSGGALGGTMAGSSHVGGMPSHGGGHSPGGAHGASMPSSGAMSSFKGEKLPTVLTGSFDEKTKGAQLRGKYEYSKGELVLGYDHSKTKLERKSNVKSQGIFKGKFGGHNLEVPTSVEIDILNNVYKKTDAIYGLNKYNVNDNLTLITGIRYEHSKYGGDRKNNTNVKYTIPVGVPHLGGTSQEHNIPKYTSDKKSSDNFAGELGINYLYSDVGTLYARYERGFISPLPGQITDKNKELNYVSNNLKSETSDNFEVGVRDYVGDTYVSWSLFTTFTNDEITLIQGNSHNPANKYWSYKNLAKTRRIGTELFAEHYFGKLTLSQGLTLINTKITKGEYKGEKVPLAPEGKVTLKANYNFTEKFNAGISFNYLGKYNVREFDKQDKSVVTKVSGHHFTDVNFQYKVTDYFVINAGINNIFNRKYNYTETKDTATPAPKRNYYIGGSLKF